MSETFPDRSRRQLLRYVGVGAALAVAGCGESTDGTGDDAETGDGDNPAGSDDDNGDDPAGSDNEDDSDEDSDRTDENANDDENAFELAGDGGTQYRHWLVPEYGLDEDLEAETKQLYQFNNYDLAAEAGWGAQVRFRDHFADLLGAEPQSFESEILVGPVDDNGPHRIFFGSFDTEAVGDTIERRGFERTGEEHEFAIYGDQIAVSEAVIIEHPSYDTFLETERGERDPLGKTDEDIALLLDLVPDGALVTLSRREGKDDLAVDAMSVREFGEDGLYSHAVRTLVFEDEADVTSSRIRELVIEESVFEEIVTEESHGRVAMAEVRR